MLYQPTNVMPSSFAGVGGDLVNDGDDLVISWQINGPSAMTAYKIVIYSNNTSSTQLYSTGQVTLSTPVYGVDNNGNVERYSVTIDYSTLTSAGIVTGNESGYKFKITQWWDTNSYVEQSADNWFIIQSAPTVSITTSYKLTSPSESISATWSQSDGVGLEWVRWTVSALGEGSSISYSTVSEPFLDTGHISTQVMQLDYDGWIRSWHYYVTLTYQFQNGYTGTLNKQFYANWSSDTMRGEVGTSYVDSCGGVFVSYPLPTYGAFELSVQYLPTITDGAMVLTGSETYPPQWWAQVMYSTNDTYYTVNGRFVWCGVPNGTVKLAFGSNLSYYYEFDPTTGIVTTYQSVSYDLGCGDVSGKPVTIVFGAQASGDTTAMIYLFTNSGSYKAGYGVLIEWENYGWWDIQLSGAQTCYYFGIANDDTLAETLLDKLAENSTAQPTFDGEWLFLTNFSDSSDAGYYFGSIADEYVEMDTIGIYREETDTGVMTKIAEVSKVSASDTTRLIDYGAVNGTTYTYHALYNYTESLTSEFTQAEAESDDVTPCAWNWILTTAEEDDDGIYHMTGVYHFAMNVTTGNISNNNAPSLLQNFTQYPMRQGVNSNYHSGSLSAYIGAVNDTGTAYVDTAAQAQAIMDLSTSTDAKFLRSRKGEMWKVDTAAATVLKLGDKYKEQPYTATLNWVETGDADNAIVLSLPSDDEWPL